MNIYFDLQNFYINNFYVRNSLMLLHIFVVICFILIKQQKIITIKDDCNFKNYFFKYVAIYGGTIIPINLFSHLFLCNAKAISFLSNISYFCAIIVIAFVVASSVYLCRYKNKTTVLYALKTPIIVAIYGITLIDAICGELVFWSWYNILLLLYLVFLSTVIDANCIQFKSESSNDSNKSSLEQINHYPINQVQDLYVERKWQKEQLLKIIEKKDFVKTICVSGEWGQGKTSFINVLETDLDKLYYPIIHINALDFSGLDALFKYYFERIENFIENSGYYNGICSEFSNFTKKLADVILDYNNIKITTSNSKDYTYISEKKKLQAVLSEALRDRKLIVIVDDIERCDSEISVKFIRFIKEIATFDKSVILFLSDYEELLKIPGLNEKYMQKFIDYRFDLRVVNYREILNNLKINKHNLYKLNDSITIDIEKNIDLILLKWEKESIKYDEKKSSISTGDAKYTEYDELHDKYVLLIDKLSIKLNNPRTINKLCENIFEYKDRLLRYLDIEQYDINYFSNIKIDMCIVVICLIQTIFPAQFEQIKQLSFRRYIERIKNLDKNNDCSNQDEITDIEIIKELCENLWFEKSVFSTNTNYVHSKAIEFIDKMLLSPENMKDFITPFSSFNDECLSYVEKSEWNLIENVSYIDLVSMILNKYAYKESDIGNLLLKKVFMHFMEKEMQENNNINACFHIFAYANNFSHYFSPELRGLTTFYQLIEENKFNVVGDNSIKEFIFRFSQLYIGNTISRINLVLSYNTEKFNLQQFEHDKLLNQVWNEKSFNGMLKKYLELLQVNINSDCIQTITELVFDAKQYVKQFDMDKLNDISKEFSDAENLLEEYKSINKLINYVHDKLTIQQVHIDTDNIRTNINNYIEYLKTAPTVNYEEEINRLKNFSDKFFEEENLNETLLNRYNDLLTIYIEKVGGYVHIFRIQVIDKFKQLKADKK